MPRFKNKERYTLTLSTMINILKIIKFIRDTSSE